MKESAFWSLVKTNIEKLGPCLLTRVENVAGAGAADVHATWQGPSSWIELKVASGDTIHVRTSQMAWTRRRLELGSRDMCFLVRQDERIHLVAAGLVMLPPKKVDDARKVAAYSLGDLSERRAVIRTWVKPFDWRDIRGMIMRCTCDDDRGMIERNR